MIYMYRATQGVAVVRVGLLDFQNIKIRMAISDVRYTPRTYPSKIDSAPMKEIPYPYPHTHIQSNT